MTDITAKEGDMVNQSKIIEQVKDNIEESKVGRQKNRSKIKT